MLHLRITVATEDVDAVLAYLRETTGVAHLARLPGAGLIPPGDLILCDVAREVGNEVVDWLRQQGIGERGAIAVERVDVVVSAAAADAEHEAPGHGPDALVWEELEARTRADAVLTPSLLLLMGVAAGIAAVGILLDSPILIVGAMVVGPEYGPLASLCVSLVRRRGHVARQTATTLAALIVTGVGCSFVITSALRVTGAVASDHQLTERELTAFIAHPDAGAVVVAVLAGVAGMLSLTQARAGTLVGVLVSVTTIPAIADIGVAAAFGEGGELVGAASQLTANLVALLAAGALTLVVQARLTTRA